MKYESPITYHSKDMVNVKVFADRQTDRPKIICPRSFDMGALKPPRNGLTAGTDIDFSPHLPIGQVS
jgi:hypothetical protein